MSYETPFIVGTIMGLLMGLGLVFLVNHSLKKQVSYWKENYCAEVLYDFCEEVLGKEDYRILKQYTKE